MNNYQVLCWDCKKPLAEEQVVMVPIGYPVVSNGRHLAVCAACALKRPAYGVPEK